MFRRIGALWRGQVPLSHAFWDWAVIGGLVVNVTTTFASLALVMQDQRALALIVGYAIPIPYNLMALVGVWRAAARDGGDARRIFFLRTVTVIWLAILSVL